MKYLVCLVAVLPSVLCIPWVEMTQAKDLMTDIDTGIPLETVFGNFRQIHGKKYESATEEVYRKEIFKANVHKIKEHNEQYARGEKSYYLGVNQFADLTHKEFLALYTGHLHKRNPHRNASTYLEPNNVKCPDNVDWRKEGYVTEVKNQGQCGSCWSFSATGSLEGQNFRKTGVLTSLSEQQLIDCSGDYGNQGCNGGLMDQAFEYIKAQGGIDSEADYPYLAEVEDKCKYNARQEKAEVTGFVDVKSGSEQKLKKAVCSEGPISVAIDASHSSFQLYRGGVYDEPECSSEQLDHGVLVVGYGKQDDGTAYWLIKNSWGTSWGEDGYVKMVRNKENQCGVATQASYPKV